MFCRHHFAPSTVLLLAGSLTFTIEACQETSPPNKRPTVRVISTAKHERLRAVPVTSAPAIDQLAATSPPIRVRPGRVDIDGKQLEFQPCMLKGGHPLLARGVMSTIRGLAVHDDRLFVLRDKGKLTAYKLHTSPKECSAQLDLSFGSGGTWQAPRSLTHVETTSKGTMVVSDGFLGCYWSNSLAKPFSPCPVEKVGFVALSPHGRWALSYALNKDVEQLDPTTSPWSITPWTLSNLSNDETRHGPFINVTAVDIGQREVLVGGILLDTKTHKPQHTAGIVSFDRRGHELSTLLGRESPTAPPLGWVHDIEHCGSAICALDASSGKLYAWNQQGRRLGTIVWKKALGLKRPWVEHMTYDPSSQSLFLSVAQQRQAKHPLAEGLIVRLLVGKKDL